MSSSVRTTVPPDPARGGFARRVAGIPGSVIDSSTSLLQSQEHDIVRFAIGSPAGDAVPSAAFGELAHEVLGAAQSDAYDYGPTEGEAVLRRQLLGFLESQDVRPTPPEQLIVTAGGMQGLDLACKLFVDPGDVVAVEDPTYTNGTAVITSYGGEILEVPIDDHGMDVGALAELASPSRPPRMIYVIPNFQNPSGTTLSLKRRERLIELASRWGSVILEDDPYRQLRFAGEDLPSLQEMAPPDVRVVRVHTFSKILAPGLRIGWVTADPDVIARMVDAKQGLDTCTNVPLQRLVAAFMERGLLDEHIRTARSEYRARKERMQAALRERLGDLYAVWTDPDGGFFLWVTLPSWVDAQVLFPVALAEGVAFIPGSAFSREGRFAHALRLCFASTTGDRTDLGISRLRAALDAVGDNVTAPDRVRVDRA
jgi:2-aminoadipate transaminase